VNEPPGITSTGTAAIKRRTAIYARVVRRPGAMARRFASDHRFAAFIKESPAFRQPDVAARGHRQHGGKPELSV
jgi:hypothetical protein